MPLPRATLTLLGAHHQPLALLSARRRDVAHPEPHAANTNQPRRAPSPPPPTPNRPRRRPRTSPPLHMTTTLSYRVQSFSEVRPNRNKPATSAPSCSPTHPGYCRESLLTCRNLCATKTSQFYGFAASSHCPDLTCSSCPVLPSQHEQASPESHCHLLQPPQNAFPAERPPWSIRIRQYIETTLAAIGPPHTLPRLQAPPPPQLNFAKTLFYCATSMPPTLLDACAEKAKREFLRRRSWLFATSLVAHLRAPRSHPRSLPPLPPASSYA